MAQQMYGEDEGKSSGDGSISTLKELNALTEDEEVYIISEYTNTYLYESQSKHNYSLKGIEAYRAATNVNVLDFHAKDKPKWKLIKKGQYYLIKGSWRDAYLYDSEVYTKDDFKGTKYSYVATHNLAYRWGKGKSSWKIEEAKKSGYFTIQSQFRNGYLYASQRKTGYVHKKKDASMFAMAHPFAPSFNTKSKYMWRILKVNKGKNDAPPSYASTCN